MPLKIQIEMPEYILKQKHFHLTKETKFYIFHQSVKYSSSTGYIISSNQYLKEPVCRL